MTLEQIINQYNAHVQWPERMVHVTVAGDERAVTCHLETPVHNRPPIQRVYSPGCIDAGELNAFYQWAKSRIDLYRKKR
jgi:hypothetical protein